MNKTQLISILFSLLPLLSFAQNFDAELIIQNTSIEIKNNRLTKDVSYEIKINNRAGEKYTRITIPFSKLNKISNINGHIIDANANIVKNLKSSEIEEQSSISDFSLYEDDFVKNFTLKHNSYPYTIVYSYRVQQREFLYIDYWTPVISESVPTLKAQLELTVPLDYSIKYVNHSVNAPTLDTLSKTISYKWHASYADIIKKKVLSPDIFSFLPSVSITPTDFYFDKKGSFESWSSYGDWQYKIIQRLSELPESEKSKILSLTEKIEDEKEKIKVLYHYLQDNTRYINITIGTGGMKHYPASYVSQNKYGDCKALTNYFKALLDLIEIKSYYTKVYAGTPTRHIDKSFPSQQFNHVILYIPTDDKDIWLDCTSNGPFDYLGTFTQNRDALIVDANNSRFMETPAFSKDEVLEIRTINVDYASSGATTSFQNKYKGDMYERLLQVETGFNEANKSRILQNYFVEDGFEMTDYRITKLHRDSASIALTYNATSQQIYKHYGNDILISNIKLPLPQFEQPKDRMMPLQIDYPIYRVDTLIYSLPDGYTLNQGFENFSNSNRFGEYKFNINETDGKVIVTKSLLIHSGLYSVSDYEDFYSFYEKIIGVENKTQLSLNKKLNDD